MAVTAMTVRLSSNWNSIRYKPVRHQLGRCRLANDRGGQMHRLILAAFISVASLWPGMPVLARTIESGDVAAIQRAMPAVVSISVWKILPPDQPGESSRLVRFFGSGFITDPSGIIVTNKHVIDGAIDIKSTLNDGTVLSTKLIASSSLVDLAVLKADADRPLPTLAWADSNALRLGDPVLTVGNGLGLGIAISGGIVSALNRNIQDTPFDSYIQTDATINHGNSGGPLLDRDGNVVGVDTALYNPSSTGGFLGIGFAIPANTAQYVAKLLLDPKQPPPGWVGFHLQDMSGALAIAVGASEPEGAIISAVDQSGPAAQALLRPGDLLRRLDGHQLNDARAFMRKIAETPIGKTIHLTIWRARKEQEV
ncbi:MAG TPA: trypsin-like peptidase domain-containing protein, partial [Acetobacteraceae bacterium]|nr:trypsin-like peptidase domain-containing protein [Acetobacteraceae bacterium]